MPPLTASLAALSPTALLEGEPGTVEAFAQALAGSLKALFMHHFRTNEADAEDLTNETILRALKYLRSYDPARGQLHSWVFSIARSTVLDRKRKDVRREAGESAFFTPEEMPSPQAPRPRSDAVQFLRDKLTKMVERDILLLNLGSEGVLSWDEIAEATGLSCVNARVRYLRLRKRLRKQLLEALKAHDASQTSHQNTQPVALPSYA